MAALAEGRTLSLNSRALDHLGDRVRTLARVCLATVMQAHGAEHCKATLRAPILVPGLWVCEMRTVWSGGGIKPETISFWESKNQKQQKVGGSIVRDILRAQKGCCQNSGFHDVGVVPIRRQSEVQLVLGKPVGPQCRKMLAGKTAG